jgi:dihydropteroate synthase
MEDHLQEFSLNIKGNLLNINDNRIMAIVNLSPDSFYRSSCVSGEELLEKVHELLEEGASFIDIGALSSRPGATLPNEKEELNRLIPALEKIRMHFPDAVISVDTFRSAVAKEAVKSGADMINDIGAGFLDELMFETIADLKVPYIIMHMQGKPENMQIAPSYENVCLDILRFFSERLSVLKELGVKDIIIDPGFGFGKTTRHNYEILKNLSLFRTLEMPILAGLSRKSMIYSLLNINPEQALNGSTVVHTLALLNGADILRVHDVREAKEVLSILEAYKLFAKKEER